MTPFPARYGVWASMAREPVRGVYGEHPFGTEEAVDIETAEHLLRIHRAAGLLGTRCLLSGLSPEVARMLTTIGIELGDIVSFSKLQAALEHALCRSGELAQVSKRGSMNRKK